ncbi:MAG: MMPL family transporter [Deltaproteobacteria bacterium]|nr:MMPL family transporter [Deltaproteobacteria bacterium]
MTGLMGLINSGRRLRFVIRHPVLVLTLIGLLTLIFATKLPGLRFQTSIYDLAIENLPESVYYRQFKKTFGSEEMILVVAKANDFFAPETFKRLGEISNAISKIEGVKRVLSLPGIKQDMDLTNRWTPGEFQKIINPIALFKKNFLSEDQKTAVMSVLLDDVSNKTPVIQGIEKLLEKENRTLSLYQIGMPLVSKALADYTVSDFQKLPPVTFLIMTLVLLFLFRDVRSVLIPSGSVLFALIWTFGMMAWTRTPLSLLTMIVPIFLIAVGTAYCMYILSAYRSEAEAAQSSKEAVYGCFIHVRFPTVLAVITTIIGIGSLMLNRIYSIRAFSAFSCLGLLSLLVMLLFGVPAVLSVLPLQRKGKENPIEGGGPVNLFLGKIIHLNIKRRKWVLLIVLLVSAIAISGITRIHVETNPVGFFKENTPISRNFADVARQTSGSFPVNVVLNAREEGYFEDPAHLAQLAKIQSFLNGLEGVDKTISLADFLKLVNYATNEYKKKAYALPEEPFEVRMLINSYKTMLGQEMFKRFMDMDMKQANILLRTHISGSRDFLALREKISHYLQKNFSENFDAHVTGFGIVISQSSQLLTRGLVKSLSLTLVLIIAAMSLLFLSARVGFMAIIPNLFPIVISFGFMGWFGIELSVATSLIASIAIGLAVDDTIHYLVRYNEEFKKDLDKDRALRDTLYQVGRPIIFTTLAISLGFSILIFSHFEPTAVFGLLMVVTMLAALAGALLILPSIMLHVELVTAWDLLRLMPTMGGISPGVAHELNQPLNAIKVGSEFLKMMAQKKQKIPDDRILHVATEISGQVDRASIIISRLTELEEKRGFEKEKVQLNDVIRKTLAIVEQQLLLDNIKITRNLDQDLPLIFGQTNRLEQVMYNLLSNASDAILAAHGDDQVVQGRLIAIRSFMEENRVKVSVSDTGTGIPTDLQERIFEPFFTGKTEGKGAGLGLCISREIVKNHGGRIDVKSWEKRGSTFVLSFPKARETGEI